jgi:hypothetical protein
MRKSVVCFEDFLDAFAKLRKATISFVMFISPSFCLHERKSATSARIFMKFDIWGF